MANLPRDGNYLNTSQQNGFNGFILTKQASPDFTEAGYYSITVADFLSIKDNIF